MKLVVGLGNPGKEYQDTRHNAGFEVIDKLADHLSARYWKVECGALTAKVKFGGEELLLAKPQSFMNCSGGPVSLLAKKYVVSPADIVVIHDEMDIPPATVKVKFGGGHAGHNGLRSLCDKLQTRDWARVRVGIGHPPGRMATADFVLSVPKGQDADDFAYACDRAAQAARVLLDEGLAAAQRQFN